MAAEHQSSSIAMKHILNFYVHHAPEANELKWVGQGKRGGFFEIRKSTNEIDYTVVHTIEVRPGETDAYEWHDADHQQPDIFYQVAYCTQQEEIQVSPVERIKRQSTFSWKLVALRAAIAVLLIVGTIGLRAKLTSGNEKPANRPFKAPITAVKVAPVEYTSFNTQVTALGKVISTQPLDIISEVSGKILPGDLPLRKARAFKRDDLLFRIDNTEAILNLKSQRSTFLNALVLMLPDLQLDFPDQFDKWNNYFLSIDIDQPLPTLPTTSSEREKTFVATKNLLSQYYSIKSAEERLTRYTVRAPYTGSITEVYTDAGSVANIGTRVVRIMRTDQLEVEVPVRKEDLPWITIGSTVQLLNEAETQTTTGRVVRISDLIDASTQSVNVYVSLAPGTLKLFEGMYLKARLAGRTVTQVMEIDRKAVFEDNKVFVMQPDSTIRERTIQVQKVNTETLLFNGLQPGERVINDNLLGLSTGSKIKPL